MSESVLKVMYVMGQFDNQAIYKNFDIDSIIDIAKVITKQWDNMEDIQSLDERGYIIPYAIRKIKENYLGA